ncbi:hypothetical protein ANTPLA_LOCUS10512 [Anthophora plagiata]
MIQIILNKNYDKNSEHMQDNNANNYQQCVPISEMSKCILQQNNTNVEKNIVQIQKHLDITETNKNTSELNVNNKLVYNNLIYSKLLDETLIHKISDYKNKNSYIKDNLLSVKLSQLKHNYFAGENCILRDGLSKIRHRKKLYTAEDSPTDLIKMKCYNKNRVFKSQQNLHPALDFGCKLRKHKIFKMRKRNYLCTFNRSLMNINQLNSSCDNRLRQSTSSRVTSIITNNNVKSDCTRSINYNESENLMKCNTKECMNTFLSTNEYIHTENNIVEEELTNKKLNEVIADPYNLNDGNRKFKKQNGMVTNLTDLNPIICLTRLLKFEVPKFNKQNKMVIKFNNLNPVVRLKQLSKIEIQKYKKSTNMMTNLGNLNPTVQLKKLSSFDIKKYRSANNENTK